MEFNSAFKGLKFLAGVVYFLRKVSPKTLDRTHAVKVKAVLVSGGQ